MKFDITPSAYTVKTIEVDLNELQKSAEQNKANDDDDGNRIACDADEFC